MLKSDFQDDTSFNAKAPKKVFFLKRNKNHTCKRVTVMILTLH
jgi:hypothetical protein